MPYQDRIVDSALAERLQSAGAVLIEGPKACGKTETARHVAKSEVRLDVDEEARRAANIDPSLVLEGPTPRLIDEWQVEPRIWNHVRRAVDDRQANGQFILTGSSVPADDATRHSGVGRFSRLRMRPMSLFELGESTGAVRLAALLDGESPRAAGPNMTVPHIAELVATGGWPLNIGRSLHQSLRANRDYLEEVSRVDIGRVDDKRRDPARVQRVLAALACNVATYASATTIAADASDPDTRVNRETVSDYLGALERLMVVEDQPAWAPHLRSRATVRSLSKRHFVDPSLAVAAMQTGPNELLHDLNFFGFLFESMVVRDLRVYAEANDAIVRQYRDSDGLEIDALVLRGGRSWGAFEIKLGANKIDEGAASLLKFASRLDSRRGSPVFLAVIVGTGYAYMRDDGVAVVPIGTIAP